MQLRALCVGRHPFLSDHICRVFDAFGLETTSAVGLDGALAASRRRPFDLVVCDYDLLAVLPLEAWERDELLSRIPVVAVSLTRRSEEVHLLDVNGIAGFFYLPQLDRETALRVLGGCRRVASPFSLPSPFERTRQSA
jgi:hypothetical protein